MHKGANVCAKSCHGLTALEEAKRSLTKNESIKDVIAFLEGYQVSKSCTNDFYL